MRMGILSSVLFLSGCAHMGWALPRHQECPEGYSIKGNASSHIYHMPGGTWYDKVNPERCFRTEGDARKWGYHALRQHQT